MTTHITGSAQKAFPTQHTPVIGIACGTRVVDGYSLQAINQFFIDAVRDFGGVPIAIPAPIDSADIERILTIVDGVILPGGSTHVAPHHFGATYVEDHQDQARDNLALTLIRRCVDLDKPILGVCRGFQEMNVAMGGTLHRRLHDAEVYMAHQEPEEGDFSVKYAAAHPVTVSEHGLFRQWFPDKTELEVNSLHWQGADKIAASLTVEAVAPDGLVEAFSVPDHRFFVGVQWHPEWQATQNSFSKELFTHFMAACEPKA